MGNTVVHFARYGTQWQHRDVASTVQQQLGLGQQALAVNNGSMGGDPAPGCLKVLHISYTHNGVTHTRFVPEGQVMWLQDGHHHHHRDTPAWWAAAQGQPLQGNGGGGHHHQHHYRHGHGAHQGGGGW